jgi:hypothetical protein
MSKPRAITELLADHFTGPLEMTIRRGKKLQQLSRFIQSTLDPEMAAHCQLLNLRNESLIMACDSTVWATRLRYHIPSLLLSLQQQTELGGVVDIQIRVRPVVHSPPQQVKRRAVLSTDAAYCIQQCAQSVTDPGLSRALQQLARRKSEQT